MRLTMQNEKELLTAIRGTDKGASSTTLIRVHGITLAAAVSKSEEATSVTIYPANNPNQVIYQGSGTTGECYADAADAIEGAVV